jgi:glycosyltransferase involved in cell wall biosynthesis
MNGTLDAVADELRGTTPAQLDLTIGDHLDQLHSAADRLLDQRGDAEFLDELEQQLFRGESEPSLGAHVAVKLARAKAALQRLRGPRHLSVVFAVFKEHQRILPRSEHEIGEDFLRRKLQQLEWQFDCSPEFSWDLSVVDDGCPEGSGAIAEQILAGERLGARARVLYLQDAIEQGHPVASSLRSTADSQKGASIEYGMARAIEEPRDNHIVVYTDADLSTNLAQVGLLIDGIERDGVDAAIGCRRQPTSVAVKRGRRNVRGKLFIFLWKRLLSPLHDITDAQCGFKAFRAEVLRDILADVREKKFAFDLELLLKTELRRPGSITRIPIAWIDSEAASTTSDISPYLPMLEGIVAMYRRFLPATSEGDAYAAFIESLDEAAWQKLLDAVPSAIADGDPRTFDARDLVDIAELRRGLGPADDPGTGDS